MKQKGFTLIELLGVISLLAVIALLASAPVTKLIKDSNRKACEKQFDTIITAAKLWGNETVLDLPDVIGQSTTVSVDTLKKAGYLEKELKNPLTKEDIPIDIQVKVIKKGKKYWEYSFVEDVKHTYCKSEARPTIIPVTKINVINSSVLSYPTGTVAFEQMVTVSPSNATTPTLNFTSDNESVVTVLPNQGVLRCEMLGDATITVRTTDGSNLTVTVKIICGQ